MTKRLQSKHRISRRFGEDLWGRAKNSVSRKRRRPGQVSKLQPRRPTEYGIQLGEKQKFKFYYGNVGEKQLKNYYKKAVKIRGNTEELMVGLLESRLDVVVYKSRFTKTIFAARQFVSHKHVLVNGKSVNIPSYILSPGDVVSVRPKGVNISNEAFETETLQPPAYIEVDNEKLQAKFSFRPKIEHVCYPVMMNLKTVVEYYSR